MWMTVWWISGECWPAELLGCGVTRAAPVFQLYNVLHSLSRGQSSTVGLGQAVGWVLCCLLDCESVLQSRWVLPVSIISAQQKPVVGEEPWKNPAAGRGRENLWLLNTEILWAWFSKLVEWVWVLLFLVLAARSCCILWAFTCIIFKQLSWNWMCQLQATGVLAKITCTWVDNWLFCAISNL